MILNEKNKKPIITFGLGRTELTASIGSFVKIEQIQILNPNNTTLLFDGIERNVYGFQIIADATKEIEVELSNKENRIIIASNKIKLTVI